MPNTDTNVNAGAFGECCEKVLEAVWIGFAPSYIVVIFGERMYHYDTTVTPPEYLTLHDDVPETAF